MTRLVASNTLLFLAAEAKYEGVMDAVRPAERTGARKIPNLSAQNRASAEFRRSNDSRRTSGEFTADSPLPPGVIFCLLLFFYFKIFFELFGLQFCHYFLHYSFAFFFC